MLDSFRIAVGSLQKPTNCLSVFDQFVGLALKRLTNKILSAPNVTVPEEDYKSIQRKHPKKHQNKIMKDYVKDRFDMILVTTALLKLCCNLIHSSQHGNKFILCKTNILKFLFNTLQFLSLSFILSFILNWLVLKA